MTRISVAWNRAKNSSRAPTIGALRKIPTWSSLNTIGKSRLVSLTVLIPFLGSLLLFNQQIVDLLSLAPELVSPTSDGRAVSGAEATRTFTLSRLYYAYFGLAFLGIASFLFIISCPREIATYGNVHTYIETERTLLTPSRVRLLLFDVANDFLTHNNAIQDEDHWLSTVIYPLEFHSLFFQVCQKIFPLVDEKLRDPEVPASAEGPPHYYTERGEIDPYEVAASLSVHRQVDRAVGLTFADVVAENPIDILTLRYTALDYSRLALRILVTVSYGVGFIILFIPTVGTFWTILRRVTGL